MRSEIVGKFYLEAPSISKEALIQYKTWNNVCPTEISKTIAVYTKFLL